MISESPASYVSYIKENWFVGIKNRLLQEIARKVPGAMTYALFSIAGAAWR